MCCRRRGTRAGTVVLIPLAGTGIVVCDTHKRTQFLHETKEEVLGREEEEEGSKRGTNEGEHEWPQF